MTIRVRGGEDIKGTLVTRPFYAELVELLEASAPPDRRGEVVTPDFQQILALPDIPTNHKFHPQWNRRQKDAVSEAAQLWCRVLAMPHARLGDQINQWVALWSGLFDIAAKALLVLIIPSAYAEVLGKRAAAILAEVERRPFDPVLHEATVTRVADQLQQRHAHWVAKMHAADQRLRASVAQQPPPPPVRKTEVAGIAATLYRFQQAADGLWTVSYAGDQRVGLKDLEGMALICALLAAPGQVFHSAYLLQRSRRRPRTAAMAGPPRFEGVPTLDARAVRDMKSRLKELAELSTEANDRGDHEEAEQFENESEVITAQLTKDVAPAGRPRHIGSDAERDRQTASRRYRTASTSIKKSLPVLADHLRRCVRPGRKFVYQPDNQKITWMT
jgi:hypothetical protein